MGRTISSDSLSAKFLTLAFILAMLSGTIDLHAVLHQVQDSDLDAGTHGVRHPEPVHLDHGAVDVQCPGCLFGLQSQNWPAEKPAIARSAMRSRLAGMRIYGGVAGLSYRLPLSRAPPLSCA